MRTEPPAHLSPASRRLWIQLQSEYDLADGAATALLEVALTALDRAQSARRILAKQGLVVRDKSGKTRAHPAAGIERDASKTFTQTLRLLNLDIVPLSPKAGRQPGKHYAHEAIPQSSRPQ